MIHITGLTGAWRQRASRTMIPSDLTGEAWDRLPSRMIPSDLIGDMMTISAIRCLPTARNATWTLTVARSIATGRLGSVLSNQPRPFRCWMERHVPRTMTACRISAIRKHLCATNSHWERSAMPVQQSTIAYRGIAMR